MSPGKNSAGQTETVLISSGPKSTATITVRSDGHTDVFSVPQSPLLKRRQHEVQGEEVSDRDLTGEMMTTGNTGVTLECVHGVPDRDGKRLWLRMGRGTYLLSDIEPAD